MGRDLPAEGAGRHYHRAHFIVHHLLVQPAGDVAEHPAGRRELDDVGAGADLLAHRAAAIVGTVAGVAGLLDQAGEPAIGTVAAVAMAAGHRHHPRRRQDRRAGELPGIDGVAKRDDEVRIAAQVADGGETGKQGLARIQQGGERFVLIVASRRQQPRLETIVESGQMDVTVDQTGQDGRIAKVDHTRTGNVDEPVAHFGDGAAADDDCGVAARRFAGLRNQHAGVNDCHLFRQWSGRGRSLREGRCGSGECKRENQSFHEEPPVQIESSAWSARPTRPPTKVPLMRMYWRSRPTALSRRSVIVRASHPRIVSLTNLTIEPP